MWTPWNQDMLYNQDTLFGPNAIETCIILPLKSGHLSNQDTFSCSQTCLHLGVPLYSFFSQRWKYLYLHIDLKYLWALWSTWWWNQNYNPNFFLCCQTMFVLFIWFNYIICHLASAFCREYVPGKGYMMTALYLANAKICMLHSNFMRIATLLCLLAVLAMFIESTIFYPITWPLT